MIVTRKPWHAIADGSLIIGPSGRVWQLVCKFTDQYGRTGVDLADPQAPDIRTSPHIDPHAEIDVITSEPDMERAVDSLSRSFNLQRM